MINIKWKAGNEKREVKTKNFLLLASCLLLFVVAGCATTTDFEVLKSNVANLQADSSSLKKEISDIKSSIPVLSSDLSTLKEQGFTAIRESQASLLTQMSDLSKETQMLKGRFDENKYFIDKSVKDLLAEKELQQAKLTAIENELRELKTKISVVLPETKESSSPADKKEGAGAAEAHKQPPSAESKTQETHDPQKLYDDAQIDFKEKKYADARQKFEKFTKDFPKHNLLPNAYFWIGETFYSEKKYEDAILSYENFLKKYPSHDKTKGAMLKQAYAFIEFGDKKTGKVILERLIEKYPQSTEAELAEKKIAEVLSKNTGGSGTGSKSKKKKK